MSAAAARCVKLLLVLTLVPLALRAALLLLGGHGAVPASSSSHSHHRQSPPIRSGDATTAAATTGRASISAAAGSVLGRPYRRQTRHRRRAQGGALAAFDGTRRLRQLADGWFEDDKRLAPTGSNPLHNLR